MRLAMRPMAGLLAALTVVGGGFWAAGEEGKRPAASERLGSSAMRDSTTRDNASRESAPRESSSGGTTKQAEQLREGTRLIDMAGTFQGVGERVVFSPTGGKDSYRVLENLALQRISQTLDEGQGQRPWLVSGTITEFKGANYLLVAKAVIQ